MKRFGLLVLAVLSLVGCTRQVPPASVGIKFNASSGISEKLVKPQVLWVGIRDQLIVYPTSIRNATYTRNTNEGERQGDDSIAASTSEGSILPVDLTVSYHVEPHNVVRAFENFGSEDLQQIQRDYGSLDRDLRDQHRQRNSLDLRPHEQGPGWIWQGD